MTVSELRKLCQETEAKGYGKSVVVWREDACNGPPPGADEDDEWAADPFFAEEDGVLVVHPLYSEEEHLTPVGDLLPVRRPKPANTKAAKKKSVKK
jgi:hypothetical protein